jgi:hypothetical protein
LKALDRLETFLFEAPLRHVLTLIAAVCLLRTGIWTIPNMYRSRELAVDPFQVPFDDPQIHYLVWSWLSPFTAWLLGATGSWSYFLLHLAFSVAFSVLCIRMIVKTLPQEQARIALVLFALLPVSTTAYFWVGYDSITLFLLALPLAAPHPLSALAAGLCLGMQHFEQGVCAGLAMLLFVALSRSMKADPRYSLRLCAVLLLSVIGGRLLMHWIADVHGMNIQQDRAGMLFSGWKPSFKQMVFNIHYSLWSLLGIGWYLALKYLDLGFRSLPLFVPLVGLLLMILAVLDQTRVLAIVSFPLLMSAWILNQSFLGRFARAEATLLAVLGAAVPYVWVWEGLPQGSVLSHGIVWLVHAATGWPDLPADLPEWPFRRS